MDTFVLWADLGVSLLVMVVGMFLVPGLNLAHALVAILVGAVIGNLLLGLIATIGSDTGCRPWCSSGRCWGCGDHSFRPC